jgi:pilus assembly protein Flp/PilA
VKKLYGATWRVRESFFAVARRAGRFLRRQEAGATLVEYALLIALIALICIVAIAALGTYLNGVFNNVYNGLTSNHV